MGHTQLVQLVDEPIKLSFADIENTYLDVFFALGIVNPSGPTLSFVAAVGSGKVGDRLPIVNVMLNPFLQRVDQVGWYTVAEKWNPRVDLEGLIGLEFGDCPTIVMVNKDIQDVERVSFIAEILSGFPDQVQGVEASIKGFYGNPKDRVSAAMAGKLPEADLSQSVAIASNALAVAMVDPKHFWHEMSAFLYAWNGSINLTGIPKELQVNAFSEEKFKDYFSEYVVPSLYLPPDLKRAKQVDENSTEKVDEPQGESFVQNLKPDQIRALLKADDWSHLSKLDLFVFLQAALLLYGSQVETTDIPFIRKLYQAVLVSGRTEEEMVRLENQVRHWQGTNQLAPVVYLPFIVEDSNRLVAAEATIDFVSTSPYVDKEKQILYAVTELQSLFEMGAIANPGAVFGALVAMGDPILLPLLDLIRPSLTAEQALEAAQCRNYITTHGQVQYWIRWAKSILEGNPNDAAFMTSCPALALSRNITDGAKKHGVHDGKRNFPYSEADKENFVSDRKHWSFEEYAELIAPQLYELEALEPAPKLFSTVLMCWGLKPAAALEDQYIPDEDGATGIPERLRDLSKRSNG